MTASSGDSSAMSVETLVAALVRGALDACAPRAATREAVAARTWPASVSILALGKAAPEMMRGALDAITPRAAWLVAPPGDHADLVARGVVVRVGAHPHPSDDAPARADEAMEIADAVPPDGALLALVSGGGSALLERPARGVSLDLAREIARTLMERGATIEELNAVRVALSELKGGRLGARVRGQLVTLVVEDVMGRPDLVASGPTMHATSPLADAREILARHGIAIDEALERAIARPLPPPHPRASHQTIVGNASARRGTIAAARSHGLFLEDLGPTLRGEARDEGARLAALAAERGSFVIGGETTVTLQARSGRGGRSQELVLGAYLARPHGLVIAFGTDGIDGASDHAGAYLDERAWARASALGLDARGALKRHDSERFFAALGTAIVTGPTGTNAADVACVLPRALRSG